MENVDGKDTDRRLTKTTVISTDLESLEPPSRQSKSGSVRYSGVSVRDSPGDGDAIREESDGVPSLSRRRSHDKSPSPPHSSTTATGTSTTPSSMGNEYAAPVDVTKDQTSLFSQQKMPDSVPPGAQPFFPGGRPDYGGYAPKYESAAPASPHARYSPSNYPSAIKLLVSNNVAGSIIGRQGQTISELQSQSLTRIKLSQAGDYYPGTQDRVCLVQGEPENVKTALRLLLERLYMLQEHQHSQHMAWQLQRQKEGMNPSFDFVVRLLVPSSSCGMIIGKSGSNIKFLEETTGVASVRLSPKDSGENYSASPAIATLERVVTITGPNLDSCMQCLYLILDGMASHPDICRYANMTTSYSRLVQPELAGFGLQSNRPLLVAIPSPAARQLLPDQLWDAGAPPATAHDLPPRRIASSPDFSAAGAAAATAGATTARLEVGHAQNRTLGYAQDLTTLQTFPQSHLHTQAKSPPSIYRMPGHGVDGSDVLNFPHSSSAPDLLAFQLEQSMHITPAETVGSQQYLVPVAPTCLGPNSFQAHVTVPDSMIGSILGRAGRTLNELQMMSGTKIWISQRGDYVPGTRNRLVTIRGTTAQSVWQAQVLMSQRIILPPTATHPNEQTRDT